MPVKRKPATPGFFNFDERALSRLSQAFGVEMVDGLRPILLDGDHCTLLEVRSATSRKVVVESGGERYFLKQVPWYADDARLLATSHQLQSHLFAAGRPVSRLVPAADGKTWVTVDGATFVLFEYAQGTRFRHGSGQVRGAARSLSWIHECGLPLEDALAEDWFDLVSAHLDLAIEVRGGERGAAATVALIEHLGDRLGSVRERARRAGWYEQPDRPVHGDVNPWNFLFGEDDEVTAILDFDNCDRGKRVRDVGEGLLTFCGLRYAQDSTTFDQPFVADLRPDAASAFLAAYEAEAREPLTPVELACIDCALDTVFVELAALGVIRGEVVPARDTTSVVRWLDTRPAAARLITDRARCD
jgi:Ser/Thr protein kinase RdoA (MazF antagonist)